MASRRLPTSLVWTIEIVCLIIVIILYLVFELWIKPYKRGFFCDDDSIRYPFKSETISVSSIIAISLGLTFILIAIVGVFHQYQQTRTIRFPVLPCFLDAFAYVFGAFGMQLTVNIIKVMVGRLRPYFLAVCFPNASDFVAVCNDSLILPHSYVTDFECSNTEGIIDEARLSFPSGHSSFIMYTSMFLVVYLQRRASNSWLRFLLAFLQIFLLIIGLVICMTRISDYKHHWEDVLTGGAFGSIIGILIALFLLDDWPRNEMVLPLQVRQQRQDAEH